MKIKLLSLILIFFSSNLICHADQTITIKDVTGRSVRVPFDPKRIVCLGPGALRLIVYLKAHDKVVAVEDMEKQNPRARPYWMAHPSLHKLPRCGPGGPASINKKPDLEALISVNPEVIFVTYMEAKLADYVQQTLKKPVVVLDYGGFATFNEDLYYSIGITAKILNREKWAKELIAYMNSIKEELLTKSSKYSQQSKPSVYVGGVGYRGSFGIESSEKNYIPFMWNQVNNVVRDINVSIDSHVFLNKEILLKLNPDIIFLDGGGLRLIKEDMKKRPEIYSALKAFKQDNVYILYPFNFYATNIETALCDAYAVAKRLYPEAYTDLDIAKKADEIYEFFVGKPLYKEMAKDYGELGAKLHLAEQERR